MKMRTEIQRRVGRVCNLRHIFFLTDPNRFTSYLADRRYYSCFMNLLKSYFYLVCAKATIVLLPVNADLVPASEIEVMMFKCSHRALKICHKSVVQ